MLAAAAWRRNSAGDDAVTHDNGSGSVNAGMARSGAVAYRLTPRRCSRWRVSVRGAHAALYRAASSNVCAVAQYQRRVMARHGAYSVSARGIRRGSAALIKQQVGRAAAKNIAQRGKMRQQ